MNQQLPLYQLPNAEPPSALPGKINELQLSGNRPMARSLLAGMLLELSGSSDQRWLCWVAQQPLKPLLEAGANLPGTRILQVVSNREGLCQIACRALESGRSHTVAVLVDGELDDEQRQQLGEAARKGAAECLVIRIQ